MLRCDPAHRIPERSRMLATIHLEGISPRFLDKKAQVDTNSTIEILSEQRKPVD